MDDLERIPVRVKNIYGIVSRIVFSRARGETLSLAPAEAEMVETSFMVMKVVEGKLVPGQFPRMAMSLAAELVPAPGLPPRASRYTWAPEATCSRL
jgi:hypothetical protein